MNKVEEDTFREKVEENKKQFAKIKIDNAIKWGEKCIDYLDPTAMI